MPPDEGASRKGSAAAGGRSWRIHAGTWLGTDPAATPLGVFPKGLKRVHAGPAQGRRRQPHSPLPKPGATETSGRVGQPWPTQTVGHPSPTRRRLSGHGQPRGSLGCARLSEGSPSEGAAHRVLRPRDVLEKGQLWTAKGQWPSGDWEAGGRDRRRTGDFRPGRPPRATVMVDTWHDANVPPTEPAPPEGA